LVFSYYKRVAGPGCSSFIYLKKQLKKIIAILYSRGMLIRNQYAGIEEKTIPLSSGEDNKKQAHTQPVVCIL